MTDTLMSLKFRQLEKAKQIPQNPVPKIRRVASYLGDRKHFAKHYSPRLVSIGPIHYGNYNLQLGEEFKLMWATRYLERTKQDAQALYQKIASNIKELKELFAEDVIEAFPDDEKLSWMLLVDGCALLQILEKAKLHYPEEMNVRLNQLFLVMQDVLLLENQLPYQVLKLLSGHENDATLLKIIKYFVKGHHYVDSALGEGCTSFNIKNEDALQGEHIVDIPDESPIHLLDQFRRVFLHCPPEIKQYQMYERNEERDMDMILYRNIRELKAAGIRVKSSKTRRITDVSLSCGWLYSELVLPEIIVEDTTASTFLNLIAYEMCPDFKNNYEICSYVAFMGSFIDHPNDVKELRSVEVLHNALGSDEEVVKLFNFISTDLVPETEFYLRVRLQIEKHYRNRCKTWIARSYHTYFSTPGTIIAFYAAVVALVLTIIQTACAIKQTYKSP